MRSDALYKQHSRAIPLREMITETTLPYSDLLNSYKGWVIGNG
jgi:hypothetical protein